MPRIRDESCLPRIRLVCDCCGFLRIAGWPVAWLGESAQGGARLDWPESTRVGCEDVSPADGLLAGWGSE